MQHEPDAYTVARWHRGVTRNRGAQLQTATSTRGGGLERVHDVPLGRTQRGAEDWSSLIARPAQKVPGTGQKQWQNGMYGWRMAMVGVVSTENVLMVESRLMALHKNDSGTAR